MTASHRMSPRRGIVLLAVLWTMALLSALAMAASAGFRGFSRLLAIDRDRVQAEALLTAGVESGADLLAKYQGHPLLPVGTRLALSTGVVSVRLSDELGKIDVNKAPLEVLSSLFSAVGAPDAAHVAREIVSWRDGEAKTVAAPPQEKRAPAKFVTNLGQLTQIPAVTAEHARLIAPYATVFGDETVNAATASPQVLRALPEMTEAGVDRLVEARRSPQFDSRGIERLLGSAGRYAKVATRAVARVELTATLADGYTAAAEAIIVILPKDRQPYRVLFFRPSTTFPSYGARRIFE